MEMLRSSLVCGLASLFVLILAGANGQTVYMTEHCGGAIDAESGGGNLHSQKGVLYKNSFDCNVTITADSGRQILLTFQRVKINGTLNESGGCDGDYLEIYDGPEKLSTPNLGVICGISAEDVVSTMGSITLRFKTDSGGVRPGFMLAYTSFRSSSLGSCVTGEFECDNKRCIDAGLKRNSYDNCGDSSDEDKPTSKPTSIPTSSVVVHGGTSTIGLSVTLIIIIVVVVFIAFMCLVCLCLGLLFFFYKKSQRARQQSSYQAVAQPGNQQPAIAMQPTAPAGEMV